MSAAIGGVYTTKRSLMSATIFSIVGLPRPFFKDPYLVVSAWQPSPTTWRAEYHILTKRPHEHLMSGHVDWDETTHPPEVLPIDEKFMESEAQRQAEVDFIPELEKLAHENQKPEFATAPISFEPAKTTLGFLWKQGIYRVKISDIANVTKSPRLPLHLSIVMSQRRLRPPGA